MKFILYLGEAARCKETVCQRATREKVPPSTRSTGRTVTVYGVVRKGIFEKLMFEQGSKESERVSPAGVKTEGGEGGPGTIVPRPRKCVSVIASFLERMLYLLKNDL